MALSPIQAEPLRELIIDLIKADKSWRVVSATSTLVRAIPKELEDVLPPLGTSAAAPAAWLTLHSYLNDQSKPQLGVFWRAIPVMDREARNRVLKSLLETGGTGFDYQGSWERWRKGSTPAFSGATVSDSWWPRGSNPDLREARIEILGQLKEWNSRLPRMLKAIKSV